MANKMINNMVGIHVPDPAMSVKFYAGPEAGYKKLTIDQKAIYFITDTQKVYRGNTLVASNNITSVTELPAVENAIPGMLYILTDFESNKSSINLINDDRTAYMVLGTTSSATVDPTSMVEFENKTINADLNTITNLTTGNFKEGVVVTDVSVENPSANKLITEEAFVKFMGGRFIPLTEAEYDALEEKDPNAIYIITDTQEIHRGNADLSQSVYVVDGFTKDSYTMDKLYIDKNTLETRFYNSPTEYVLLIAGIKTHFDDTIPDYNNFISTIGAIKSYVNSKLEPIDHDIDKLAPINSPTFTGVVTLPTSNPQNDLEAASKGYVDVEVGDALAEAKKYTDDTLVTKNAMLFKGTLGPDGDYTELPSNPIPGWTFKVISVGIYAGEACEVGDIIICTIGGDNPRWCIIQRNIANAITGETNVTANGVPIYANESGLLIKDSGYTIEASVPSDAKFTDTTYTLLSPQSASEGDAYIQLTSSTGISQTITLKGAGSSSITTTDAGGIVVTSKDTKYAISGSAVTQSGEDIFTITLTDSDNVTSNVKVVAGSKINITQVGDSVVFDLNELLGTDIKLTNYTQGSGDLPITENDNVSTALGKLERRKAPVKNPVFEGIVTLPSDPDSNLGAATKHYVDTNDASTLAEAKQYSEDIFSTLKAMVYKGTVGTSGDISELPGTATAGWTYKIITPGVYAGEVCEEGDLAICSVSGTPPRWTFIQRNIAKAITSSETLVVDGVIPIYDGITGTILKSSGKTIGTSVPENAVFTDTTYTFTTPRNADNGDVVMDLTGTDGSKYEIGIKGINGSAITTGPTGDIIVDSKVVSRIRAYATTISTKTITVITSLDVTTDFVRTRTYMSQTSISQDKMHVNYYHNTSGYGCSHYVYDKIPTDAEILAATVTVPVLSGKLRRIVDLKVNEINASEALTQSLYDQTGTFAAPGHELDHYSYQYEMPFEHDFDVTEAITAGSSEAYFTFGSGIADGASPATEAILGTPTLKITYQQDITTTNDALIISIFDNAGEEISNTMVLAGDRISIEITPEGYPIIHAAAMLAEDMVLGGYKLIPNDSPINQTDNVLEAFSKLEYSKATVSNPTFKGTVTLAKDPGTDLEAATKRYVDDQIEDYTTWNNGETPTDTRVKNIYVSSTDLSNIPVVNGQKIYTTDTNEQYLDLNNLRVKLGSIIFIATESDRESIQNPVEEVFYLVHETGTVWYRTTDADNQVGVWVPLNNQPRIIDCGGAFG